MQRNYILIDTTWINPKVIDILKIILYNSVNGWLAQGMRNLGGDRNLLYLIVVVVSQVYTAIKIHQIEHFQWIHLTAGKLNLNKIDYQKF